MHIQDLPRETLYQILAFHASARKDMQQNTRGPALVSRAWFEMVTTTPEYWQRIRLGQADWQEYANRSRNRPLTLCVHNYSAELNIEQINRLLQLASRCEALLLDGGPVMLRWVLANVDAFPRLARLRLMIYQGYGETYEETVPADMSDDTRLDLSLLTALRSFELSHDPQFWGTWLRVGGLDLTTLRVGDGLCSGHQFDEFLLFLQGMPRLENLYLGGQSYDFHNPPANPYPGTCLLPRVIRLEVGILSDSAYQVAFFQAVRAPLLEDLRINDISRGVSLFRQNVANQFPRLKYLFVGWSWLEYWHGKSCISLLINTAIDAINGSHKQYLEAPYAHPVDHLQGGHILQRGHARDRGPLGHSAP